MDADIVFKRVAGADYGKLRENVRLIKVFVAMDGKRSIGELASDYNYEMDDLIAMVDQIKKMGLIVPVDGAKVVEAGTDSDSGFANLPAEFHTGIEIVDKQHQRLVEMLTQLDMVRKTQYGGDTTTREAVGNVIAEMNDYTFSHFAFEEALMEDAQYEFLHAHKRIHEAFVGRVNEYKKRFEAEEDIVDELYGVLNRWLFNHIRNDDKAYAPSVKARLKALDRSKRGWLNNMLRRFFH
jgi:hemerythrin